MKVNVNKEELQQAFREVMTEGIDQISEECKNGDLDQQIQESQSRMDWEKIYETAQKRRNLHFRQWPRVAAVVLVALLVGTATVYALEKIRQARVQWEADWGRSEDKFQFEVDNPVETALPQEEKKAPDEIERRYHLNYVTDGFKESGENRQKKSYRITYKNGEDRIYFYQLTKAEKTTADPGLTGQESIDVNGYEGQIGCKGKKRILRFVTGEYVFQISTRVPIEWKELIRMAQSLSKMPPDEIETYYEPEYIPDEYEMSDEECVREDWMYQTTYKKDKKHDLVFLQTISEGAISIDSEKASREEVDINGWKGQLNKSKKKKTVIWATNDYVFVISAYGEIDEKELIRMAESVVPEK